LGPRYFSTSQSCEHLLLGHRLVAVHLCFSKKPFWASSSIVSKSGISSCVSQSSMRVTEGSVCGWGELQVGHLEQEPNLTEEELTCWGRKNQD
jgi:hypothetical protein